MADAPRRSQILTLLPWFWFVVFFGLLQLVVVLWHVFFEHASLRMFLMNGPLLFYANAVGMRVLLSIWDSRKVLAKCGDSAVVYVVVPLLIMVISILTFCKIIEPHDVKPPWIIVSQCLTVPGAWFVSAALRLKVFKKTRTPRLLVRRD